MWIPIVALLRLGGVALLPPEEAAWFPADELREFHGITEHEVGERRRGAMLLRAVSL